MTETYSLYAIFLAQTVGAAFLALLLARFHRMYGHSYLNEWSWSWVALSVYIFGGFLGVVWTRAYPPQHPVRISVAIASVSAGYAHIAWLLAGTYTVACGRAISGRRKSWLLGGCVAVGAISVILYTWDPGLAGARFFARVGLRSVIAGIAYLWAGIWLVRGGGWRRGSGRVIVIGALLLYGVEQLNYFAAISFELLGLISVGGNLGFLGFLDLLLQFAMGVGMVIWLLEDERDELASTAHALRRSEERLRRSQRLEAAGQLAGGVAHDFNNLLTVITGRVQRLLSSLKPDADDWEDARQIDEAAQRSAELVRQLLAFSRRQVLTPQHVNVNDVVHAVAAMLHRSLREDIGLETDPDDDLGWVRVDPAQLEHVLVNLALNARDAMPDGGTLTIGTRNVDVRHDAIDPGSDLMAGSYVELTVRDTGVGIDDETQRRIFEPFYTTKEVGKGSGLGLATAYGIVRQSDGSVFVESAPGRGTTVRVFLPRVDALVEGDATSAAGRDQEPRHHISDVAGASSATRGKGTILVVEDEERIRRLLITVLREDGYEVVVAGNGVDALEVVAENGAKIDLLLTDVVMPKMGGPELADVLEGHNPGLKVVFMSGYSEEILGSRLAIKHHALLEKPFSLSELLERIRTEMEG